MLLLIGFDVWVKHRPNKTREQGEQMIPDLNVLIIGGNRFVGKLLASKLLAQGHHLTLLNRGNLDDGFGNRVERINCDRNNTIDLVNAISGRRWDVIYDQLCFGVKQAEQACELFKNKTQQYIFSSSQAVYGLGAQLREENFNPRKYKILGVSHDYTKGKQQAEAYLYAHAPWPVIAARLPIIIGSDEQNGRLAFHLARMRSEREIFFPTLDAHISLISAEGAADCLAFFLGKEINEPVNCAPVES
ncbi:MAG: nucleoside-diphosphate-sugar epimerase, partial [Lentisphaeria bacterium]